MLLVAEISKEILSLYLTLDCDLLQKNSTAEATEKKLPDKFLEQILFSLERKSFIRQKTTENN